MSVLEVLRASTDYLAKRKIDDARLNAEHLVADVLGLTRMQLYLGFENQVNDPELQRLREFVRRRGQGEPLQHLLGTVEFCGHVFKTDKRALVPRPETEQLVELLVSEIGNPQSEIRILDIGTGSGVIALSLASKFPEAKVVATDISDDALALAYENADRLGLTDRIRWEKSDLLEKIGERFELIVANLPYVSMNDRNSLSREVLHDPEIAVFAGRQGDELICQLIEQVPLRLDPNGLLALEIGLGQADRLHSMLRQKNFHDIEAKKDYSGIPRFLFSRYG